MGVGSPRRQEGGGRFFIENPRRGGVSRSRRGCEAGRVSAANWGIFGGGGRNVHQEGASSSLGKKLNFKIILF